MRRSRADALGQFLQTLAQYLVVVAAERIAGQVGQRRVVHDFISRACRARPVVHAHRDDAGRAGHQVCGAAAACAVARHVVHLAMTAGCQPVQQVCLVCIQPGRTDADLLEAERLSPALDVGRQGDWIRRWFRRCHGDWICACASRYVADVTIHYSTVGGPA